jgi:hypothetical protein
MIEILSLISLTTVSIFLLSLWALWVFYIAMMNIKRSYILHGDVPWQAKLLVIPTTVVFNIIEFFCNIVLCTIIFLDFPREITVSSRLRRYNSNPNCPKWRLCIVHFVKPMIDSFDPEGPHI